MNTNCLHLSVTNCLAIDNKTVKSPTCEHGRDKNRQADKVSEQNRSRENRPNYNIIFMLCPSKRLYREDEKNTLHTTYLSTTAHL